MSYALIVFFEITVECLEVPNSKSENEFFLDSRITHITVYKHCQDVPPYRYFYVQRNILFSNNSLGFEQRDEVIVMPIW